MRRTKLPVCISALLIVVIVLNIVQSAAWCLRLIDHGEQNEYLSGNFENEEELELIKISVEETNQPSSGFLKLNNHEFLYHHKLYDVVNMVVDNGVLYFYCHNDSKEELILDQIQQCNKSNLDYIGSSHQRNMVFAKVLVQEYTSRLISRKKIPETYIVFCTEKSEIYLSLFQEDIDAPPESNLA